MSSGIRIVEGINCQITALAEVIRVARAECYCNLMSSPFHPIRHTFDARRSPADKRRLYSRTAAAEPLSCGRGQVDTGTSVEVGVARVEVDIGVGGEGSAVVPEAGGHVLRGTGQAEPDFIVGPSQVDYLTVVLKRVLYFGLQAGSRNGKNNPQIR